MTQNQGWIKQHRSMLYKFSENKRLNSELWTLYHYLVQKAAYEDMIDVNKGHVKMTISFIQKDFLPQFSRVKLFRMLQHLEADGSIKLTLSKNKNAGYLIEVCHYDQFYGKNDQNQCNTSETQVKHKCNTENDDNTLQSLLNNCAENEQCNTSETQVKHKCNTDECSYIEERKKKKNEEYISDSSLRASTSDAQIFDDVSLVPIKEKKTKAKKEVKKTPTKKSVNAALSKTRHATYRLFVPNPRFVTGNLFCDKSMIFFTINQLVEKHGDQFVIGALADMYKDFKVNNLIGRNPYSIDLVEECLNKAIEFYTHKQAAAAAQQQLDEIPF